MWGYHDVTDPSDAAMEPPVCWITNAFDRSPAEIVRVEGRAGGRSRVAAEPLVRLRQGLRRAARDGRRADAGRRRGPADPAVPDRRDARAVPPGRRPALRLRHVRLGRQPDSSPAGSTGSGRRASRPCSDRPARPPRRDGDHVHRPDRPGLRLRCLTVRRARPGRSQRTANYGSPHVGEKALPIAASRLEGDGRTVVLDHPA